MSLFQALADSAAVTALRENGSRLATEIEQYVTSMEPSTWMLLGLLAGLIWMGLFVRAPR